MQSCKPTHTSSVASIKSDNYSFKVQTSNEYKRIKKFRKGDAMMVYHSVKFQVLNFRSNKV